MDMGPAMKTAAEQFQPHQPSEKIDYNPMLGNVEPAVRIDPHMHEIEVEPQPDLRRVADIIRDRSPPGTPEPK
jgi:hypothetical protein